MPLTVEVSSRVNDSKRCSWNSPAHADAVVADVEFVERIPFFIVRFLNNTDNDGAAVLCEFRGIAQQIQQNLVQAEKGAGRRWKSCSGIPAPGPAD